MDAAGEPNHALPAGRRRSELLRRGAEATSRPTLTTADVERLRASREPTARAEIAAKFGRQFDDLTAGESQDLAAAVLHLLVRDVEKEVRQSLAETVAGSPNLPPGIASRLARDDIEVARPLLERSPVLSDDELMEIVRTHAIQYALAVAGRETLSEAVSDALAETGDRQVTLRLVGNVGAKISVRTMSRIAEDHRGDREVQNRLVRRPALSYEMVERLAGLVADRLEWELVRNRQIDPGLARQIVNAARDRATISLVAREHGKPGPERELRRRFLDGELGPEEVLAFLREGDIASFEAGVALLADVDTTRVRRLIYNDDRRHLAALCIRAGFPVALYVVVRMTLELAQQSVSPSRKQFGYSSETMRYIHEQYDRLKADEELLDTLLDR